MKSNNILLFAVLSLLNLICIYSSKLLLNENELLANYLFDFLSTNKIEEVFEIRKKWEWLYYLSIPILLLIKVAVIAVILDIGIFFFEKKIKYRSLLNIVIQAEYFFLLVIVIKILWFFVFQQDYTFEDLQYFYPLSALNIWDYKTLDLWFIYPLQVLNVFEIVYWIILAFLIRKEIKISIMKGFYIVASSYVLALIIWVVGVMFLTLNMLG